MFSDAGATPIRFPSTANLLIDSTDRTDGETAANFSITKNQSILNGYFTRFGVTEVMLQWSIYNIQASQNTLFGYRVGTTLGSVAVPPGFYTVATLLDKLVVLLQADFSSSLWTVTGVNGNKSITCSDAWSVPASPLGIQLGMVNPNPAFSQPLNAPNLVLPNLSYIDITSNTLTYQQGLKDASTAKNYHDVLYRWYFAYDNAPPLDYYGYPILMGYQNFVLRRYLSFPKQIKWDSMQPIGQLQFQVYDKNGNEINFNTYSGAFEWTMTLLVSEL